MTFPAALLGQCTYNGYTFDGSLHCSVQSANVRDEANRTTTTMRPLGQRSSRQGA